MKRSPTKPLHFIWFDVIWWCRRIPSNVRGKSEPDLLVLVLHLQCTFAELFNFPIKLIKIMHFLEMLLFRDTYMKKRYRNIILLSFFSLSYTELRCRWFMEIIMKWCELWIEKSVHNAVCFTIYKCKEPSNKNTLTHFLWKCSRSCNLLSILNTIFIAIFTYNREREKRHRINEMIKVHFRVLYLFSPSKIPKSMSVLEIT